MLRRTFNRMAAGALACALIGLRPQELWPMKPATQIPAWQEERQVLGSAIAGILESANRRAATR